MSFKIDELDRKIANLLIADGRMPTAEIARCLGGLSERSVDYRIQRLISQGVMRISAFINPALGGYPVRADLMLDVRSGDIPLIAEQLSSLDRTLYVATVLGEHDIVVDLLAKNNSDLQVYLARHFSIIPDASVATTVLIAEVLKDLYDWLIPSPDNEPFIAHLHPSPLPLVNLSKLDHMIFYMLQKNGRVPAAEISRQLNARGFHVSARKIRSHLAKLIEDRTIHVSAIVLPEAVGYPIRSDIVVEVDGTKVQKIACRLAAMPETSYVAMPIDSNRITLQLHATSNQNLYEIVLQGIRKIPGVIKTTTTLVMHTWHDWMYWRFPEDVGLQPSANNAEN